MNNFFLAIIFFLSGLSVCGQSAHTIDSLKKELNKKHHDTTLVKLYNDLCGNYRDLDAHISVGYGEKGLALALKCNVEDYQAYITQNLANAYFNLSLYDKSKELYQKALDLAKKINDELTVSNALNGLGLVHEVMHEYDKAIKYFLESIAICEKANDSVGIAYSKSNIGVIYTNMGHYDDALKYYFESIELLKKLDETSAVGSIYGNIGIDYHKKMDFSKALKYLNLSVEFLEKAGNTGELATTWNSIGLVYFDQQRYPEAIEAYNLSYELSEKKGDVNSMAISFCNLGHVYLQTGQYEKGMEYIRKAFEFASEKGFELLRAHLYQLMAEAYASKNNYKLAFAFQKKFSDLQDSIHQLSSVEQLHELQVRYETEKKQKEIQLLNKSNELGKIQLQREQTFRYWMLAMGGVLFLLAVVVFRAYRIKKRTSELLHRKNSEIEIQKLALEARNKEVTDSITYAKRLQEAILPPLQLVKKVIPESFVLYKPKDIIAGDFYWMEQEGDFIFIAAADCTGHGVPGALVSVVCSNALNRSLVEFRLREPGEILDKTRELVLETFAKSDADVKDGMDISLLRIHKTKNEFKWAGANNDLWYISGDQLSELKANKQPIGKVTNPMAFSTHSLSLAKGTVVYLFTDGFADQFGGEKGKKLKNSSFQEIIKTINSLPLNEQYQQLNLRFEAWKGSFEQTDDVCVIGLKI